MHGQKAAAVGATVKPVHKPPSGDVSAFDRRPPVNLFGQQQLLKPQARPSLPPVLDSRNVNTMVAESTFDSHNANPVEN